LPDYAYDVTKLLLNHNEKIVHKFPYNLQSGVLPLAMDLPAELSLSSLPASLRRSFYGESKTWSDLIECMIDESPDSSYKVRFQVMDRLNMPTGEDGSQSHIVLDVRDSTARLPIIVACNDVPKYTHDLMDNKVFESTILCHEIDGTKFFKLVNKLQLCDTEFQVEGIIDM